ncbi:MAG: cytosine permease, partial [Lachnospiraceae bacterium]|nr:cytosine permease [Lachnospiraceae bacterium]
KPVVDNGNSSLVNFMLSAEGNVAFAFSWSTQALVMPRLARSERSGFWGTAISYGIVAPFFVAAGGVMAFAMYVKTGVYESDPTAMLSTLCGSGFALLSLLMVAFANVGTQGTGSYVNCMIVKSGMPKVSYKLLVIIAMVYVSGLTIWGGVNDHFGAFISLAAYIQGPIIGMTIADYLVVKKRKLSLKSAYGLDGHDAYKFTGGFNFVGIGCLIIAFAVSMLFVYNPMTGIIHSDIFLFTTGSGFTAIFGGLLYLIASITPLKKYMLRDRDDLEIV